MKEKKVSKKPKKEASEKNNRKRELYAIVVTKEFRECVMQLTDYMQDEKKNYFELLSEGSQDAEYHIWTCVKVIVDTVLGNDGYGGK